MAHPAQWATFSAPTCIPVYNPVTTVLQTTFGFQPYQPAVTASAWGAYPTAQPVQSNAYNNTGALVLYNQFPTANMPGTPPHPKPQVNPYTPGLAPLPAVPTPKTFVTEDPRAATFPCSTKAKDDPFGWITPQIFSTFAEKATTTAVVKSMPLREMTATR